MKTNNAPLIKLDWSKLFGFKQVKAAQTRNNNGIDFVLIGSKIGAKIGVKGGGTT